jgi:hypothetical protein
VSAFLQGLDAIMERFDELSDLVPQGAKRGALAGAEIVAARARDLAPRKTGHMADRLVALPTEDGAEIVGTADYTEIQETDDSLHHENGQAHFLRDALDQCEGQVMDEIAKGINESQETVCGGAK